MVVSALCDKCRLGLRRGIKIIILTWQTECVARNFDVVGG